MTGFDVVIVGARCAGAPLATMLARQGLRVCLLDRAHFPSETPSTHVIQPRGGAILADLGVFGAAVKDQVYRTALGYRLSAGRRRRLAAPPAISHRR